MNVIL